MGFNTKECSAAFAPSMMDVGSTDAPESKHGQGPNSPVKSMVICMRIG